jgi:exonuclease SbcC
LKLESILLEPFGAFGKREIRFQPGLQVILGPNEAGKSTLWHALYEVLFRPVNIDKRKVDDKTAVGRFIPVGGANYSKVALGFSVGQEAWTLEKQWQTGPKVVLTGPGSVAISGDDEVRDKLTALFPVTPAVLKTVLLSRQGTLAQTMSELAKGPALGTLSDLLRAAVQDPGGVSVNDFMKRLMEAHEAALQNWDLDANGPTDGKVLANRRKVNVGKVLKAYYTEQEKKLAVDAAEDFERRLDALNHDLVAARKIADENKRFLVENADLEKGLLSRRALEVEALDGNRRVEELTLVCRDWPIFENEEKRLSASLPDLEKQVARFDGELAKAKSLDEVRPLRERLARARPEWVLLGELQEKAKGLKKVSKEDLEALRRAEGQVKQCRLAVEAGQMKIAFIARSAQRLGVSADGAGEETKEVAAGSTLDLGAAASLKLSHADWSLSIGSGSADAQAMVARLSQAESAWKDLLAKLGVGNLEEAAALESASTQATVALEKQQGKLDTILAGMSFADLEEKLKGAPAEEALRPVADLAVEKNNAEAALKAAKADRGDAAGKVESFKAKHGDFPDVLLQLADAANKVAETKKKLAVLPSLPPEIKDIQAFLGEMEQARGRSAGLQSKVSDLEIERAKLIGPDERVSADELRAEHRDAMDAFQRCLQEARVLDRILTVAHGVKSRGGSTPLSGLQNTFQGYFATMTRGRYAGAAVEEGLPNGVLRADGQTLAYDLLSAGTQDQFGLCLRLSMAHHFLDGKEAFLVMDDPLVDMDPERQKGAAEVMKAFAARQQLIVFTCHPSHADLLGGDRIELAGAS